jgi:UDP-N-acetylglucosamine:LPS N-acetylglucosamine transferase
MNTVLTETWTTGRFLGREDKQAGNHEFDGRDVVPMTGGSNGHQRVVLNLCLSLIGLPGARPCLPP